MKIISVSAEGPRSGQGRSFGSSSRPIWFAILTFAFLIVVQRVPAQAQYAIGTSAIAANSQTVDTYSATELDPIANYYYDPYVEGYLYRKYFTSLNWQLIRSGSASGGSSDLADGYMSAPTEIRSSYQHESDHYLVSYYYVYDPVYGYSYYNPYGYGFASNDGSWWPSGYEFLPGPAPTYVSTQYQYLGTTAVGISVSPPAIEGIQPEAVVRGNSGYLALYGSYMLGTTSAQLNGGGASMGPVYVSDGQVNLSFTIDSNTSTGTRGLTLTNEFGTSNPDDLVVGDPTPRITGISPSSWEVGTQKEVVITGTGFGTKPTVNITGTGISVTIISASDSQIRCQFTIDAAAPEGSRTVTAISNGYGSNPFIPAPVQVPGQWPPTSNSVPTSNGVAFGVGTPSVTFQQFNSVLVGGTRRVNVHVDSIVPGRQVNINLRSVSGGATFANNNSTVTGVGTGDTMLAVKGNTASQSVDGVSLTAEFGPKKFEEKFTVASLKLKEVSFSGTGMKAVRKDDDSADYTAPHWTDGSAGSPVAYVKGNTATVSIKLVTSPSVSLDGVTVKVKGDGPESLDFAERSVTTGASATELVIGDYKSAVNLSATVDFFDPLNLAWQYQPPEAVDWWGAGTSSNRVYVTLADPVTTSPFLYTIVHLACKGAKGKTAPTDVFNGIWAQFATRTLTTADGSKTLKYYNPKDTVNIFPVQLIKDGNGQCGSFAKLLIDTLKVHGIVDTKYTFVLRTDSTAGTAGFMVKNWSFTSLPGKSGISEYPYLNIILEPEKTGSQSTINSALHAYLYADVADGAGIPGQSSPDPSALFGNHQFVEYNGNWYDPSYGVTYPGADFPAKLSSVEAAIDGLFQLTVLTVSESAVDRDLNGDGDKTDLVSGVLSLMIKKRPTTSFLGHTYSTW
ncbi:MAG TPA: IPT/TIG domain-containing protein [Blastocatellia bacterium]|nr:IPT/TIG domain-containing protein [Blastocatellia bacterium]